MPFFSQALWPQPRTSHFGRTHSSTTTRSTTGSETAVPSGSICRPNCNRRYRSRSHLATAIRRAEIHSWTATSPSLPTHPHCRRSDPGTGSPAQVKPAQRHPATSCAFCATDPSAHPNEHSSRRIPVFDFGCCRHTDRALTCVRSPLQSYRRTVGLWPRVVRGVLRGGWFCANPIHVPRCPATQGTPFIVGAGPPEITVGTPAP